MNSDRKCPLQISGLDKPVELWVHGDGDLHVSKAIADTGIWEAFETQLILERLNAGDCFIDVGANLGYYTVLAANKVGPQGYVGAFEPEPNNFRLLLKNISANGVDFVDAVNAGLADKHSAGQLFLNKTNFGDHQIYDAGEQRDCCDIQLLNGSDYLQGKAKTVDLLKIDTQGAESKVIAGLLPILSQSGQGLSIIIEFWPYGLRKSGSSAHRLLDMLMTLHLPIHIIDHIAHQLVPCTEQQLREWVDMVDAIPEDQGFMNILLGA
ncbi:FkbM family methyltransferase [Oceanicoccus sp. KOV_DT_Chl]|uniref:FkbM family methyltransferase n=1 Tax=Oceanicoccus sp. KOV_DT_Chl TaxID=1904639 RepID=UPI000C7A07A5|nr:FkbM family methyltransferase [Oceanicoccus sp. KOV_DT_Chl]